MKATPAAPTAPTTTSLVALAHRDADPASLSPAQRRFRKLVSEIHTERVLLGAWNMHLERHQARLAREMPPAMTKLREAQRQLVFRFDALLLSKQKGEKLKRRHRDAVHEAMMGLVGVLLDQHPEPDLVALHDRHARNGWQAQREFEVEMARHRARETFGDEAVDGIAADTPEDFFGQVLDRALEQAAAEDAERQRQKADRRAAKQRKARLEGGATAATPAGNEPQDASQALREIFRRLVSSLHPDREPDATERARKTALMQRVNEAYARADLLALLELQLETEQIDAAQLAAISEQRLKHYVDVLADQLRTLKHEVLAHAQAHGLDPLQPQRLDKQLGAQLRDMERAGDNIRIALRALDDPAMRDDWLDGLAQAESDATDLDEIDAMLLSEAPAPRRSRRRKHAGR